MKFSKVASGALLVSSVMLSSFVAAKAVSTYGSTLHPKSYDVASDMLHPPTDITVINATNNYIYAMVPNTPVNDYLAPGFNDHIYNYDPNSYSTYLVLKDINGYAFYAANVCREAVVTVYGYVGNYRINYDDDLCH